MWPREIVAALSLGKFRAEIDIVFIGEQLIEFLFTSSVGTLHFAIELHWTRFDIGMADALGVALIDFESPDTGCIVDGRVLVSLDGLVVFVLESQKLNIDLNVMTKNLLLVPDSMDFTQPCAPRASRAHLNPYPAAVK